MSPDDWMQRLENSFGKAVEQWGKAQAEQAATNQKFQAILDLLKEDYQWRREQETSCRDCRTLLKDVSTVLRDALDQRINTRWWSKEILIPIAVAFIAMLSVVLQGRATQERVVQGQQQVIRQLAGGQMEIGKALGDMWTEVKKQTP